jgi:excisionase family DNA binding protein
MAQVSLSQDVLTLEEAAAYLRLDERTVERLAAVHGMPGRRIENEWRFLKSALQDWLRGLSGKELLLEQAGALADDESFSEMLDRIYKERGRPETSEG